MKNTFFSLLAILLLASCSQKEQADLLVYNGVIYTVDSSFSVAEAMVIKMERSLKQAELLILKKSMRPLNNWMYRVNSFIPVSLMHTLILQAMQATCKG
jgi:hypothetical protein